MNDGTDSNDGQRDPEDMDRSSAEAGNGDGSGEGNSGAVLTDISPRSWEHPADRAALMGLRKIPIFDEVLKALFGMFGEKPIRLAFQANAVRVSENQFPKIHRLWVDTLRTLDAPEHYELLITQTPLVNAGAYGMQHPFVILNSGTVELLNEAELRYILGHELGHIMSGHVLYRTMTFLLLQLATLGFPIVGLAARAILVALLEWSRKAELSSDRAGLLTVQDPELVMGAMLKMAGGGAVEDTSLDEFINQAEEYRESGDLADHVFKILNLLAVTHPFWVLRVAELRTWIESGDYDRILRGEYPRRDDPDPAYQDDLRAAGRAYKEDAKDTMEKMTAAAKRMGAAFREGLGGK